MASGASLVDGIHLSLYPSFITQLPCPLPLLCKVTKPPLHRDAASSHSQHSFDKMSLLTTPQITSLWYEVQNNPQYEHSVTRLWMYLLREVFGFSGPNWNISAEQPPTGQPSLNKATTSDGDKGDLERVDLQVKYFDDYTYKFVVQVFLEAKRPAAGIAECHGNQIPHSSHAHLKHCFRTILKPSAFYIGRGVALHAQAAVLVYINARHPQIAQMITHLFRNTEYDKLEFQALRDCLEYMQKNRLDHIYAVTVVGTTARLWECQPEDQYLQSFSPQESQHLSDKSAYLEIHSTDGAVLREQFAQMKQRIIDDALLRAQSRTLPQPPMVPSQPE